MNYYEEGTSLIKTVMQEHDIEEDKAIVIVQIIAEYAIEQLPVLRGNINSFVELEIKKAEKQY